jgi:hypothetical protein
VPADTGQGDSRGVLETAAKERQMALSDQLAKLSARTKDAEARAAAAQGKAKDDVEQDVSAARAAAKAQGQELRTAASEAKGEISDWWVDAQKSWEAHIDAVRDNIDRKKATHDVDKARRRAERAEEDAALAIDAAYYAVAEADYAVLDAILARMDADDVAAAKGEAVSSKS